jgi:hypothetical protein
VDQTVAIAKKMMDLFMKYPHRNHAPVGHELPLSAAEVYLEKIWSARRWTGLKPESRSVRLSGFRVAGQDVP